MDEVYARGWEQLDIDNLHKKILKKDKYEFSYVNKNHMWIILHDWNGLDVLQDILKTLGSGETPRQYLYRKIKKTEEPVVRTLNLKIETTRTKDTYSVSVFKDNYATSTKVLFHSGELLDGSDYISEIEIMVQEFVIDGWTK